MTLHKHFNEQQWTLLKQRARRVEKAVKAQDAAKLIDVMVVSNGSERYAVPVTIVQAVYENISVHKLPSTPPHIIGIANVRGHVTTVLDISQILGTPFEISEAGVLVLLVIPHAHIALYVEHVSEVKQISPTQLSAIQNNHEEYIKGVLPDGTIFLDIQAIVDDPILVVNENS